MSNRDQLPPDIEAALLSGAHRLGVRPKGNIKYGWNRKSCGSHVTDTQNHDYWLRVQYRSLEQPEGKLWRGTEEASAIRGVHKPNIYKVEDWTDEVARICWRAELQSFISHQICSPTPELRRPLSLDDAWFETLRSSLNCLADYKTIRTSIRQDLLTRRIREYFGENIDSTIDEWTTIHGDLHWANLTSEKCWILDWEAWGVGPVALDVSFLLCYSLLQSDVAAKVKFFFDDWLETPDGIRSQLFACAELMRMTELYGDHRDLEPLIRAHGDNLIHNAPVISG